MINILYGITQQVYISWNNSVKLIESDCRWLKNAWTITGGPGILENSIVESDCTEKSDVNKTAD